MSKKRPLKIEAPEVLYHQPVQDNTGYTKIVHRTENQAKAIRSIIKNAISILIGPPGSGKTALAVGTAVHLLRKNDPSISKIIISRPAIPVFEQIGFMPGNKDEKMIPYILPMKKEFEKFLPRGEFDKLLRDNVIEIVPLAYIQGWNIEDAILLVDEAALMNFNQFGLVLSRLCEDGKIVLMGDPVQDGGSGTGHALERIATLLDGLDDIGVVRFIAADNQRHKLVNKIQKILLGADSRAPLTLEDRFKDDYWGQEYKLYGK